MKKKTLAQSGGQKSEIRVLRGARSLCRPWGRILLASSSPWQCPQSSASQGCSCPCPSLSLWPVAFSPVSVFFHVPSNPRRGVALILGGGVGWGGEGFLWGSPVFPGYKLQETHPCFFKPKGLGCFLHGT